ADRPAVARAEFVPSLHDARHGQAIEEEPALSANRRGCAGPQRGMAQRAGERMTPRLVLVGNRGCRRIEFWNAARARLGWPTATLLTYRDLLVCPFAFHEALDHDALVRFESPSGDWETYRGLLRHGI